MPEITPHDKYSMQICTHSKGSKVYESAGGPVIELEFNKETVYLSPALAVLIGRCGAEALRHEEATIEHPALPVAGYAPTQSGADIALVNEGKELEERVLRYSEKIGTTISSGEQERFLAIGRTQIQLGFMALVRAVFHPDRIRLPEDSA